MKTIEIVVDELPDSCAECNRFCAECVDVGGYVCCALFDASNNIARIPSTGRLDDCPLIAWQSSESAPRDGSIFYISMEGGTITGYANYRVDTTNNEKYFDFGGDDITHEEFQWRPLPKTPEVK